MKPRILLAEATTPEGGRLTLHVHDGAYKILLNNQELMHSVLTYSETEMGKQVAARLQECEAPRYLVGGLGLGFTLKALHETLPLGGHITVAELIPEIVAWNRELMRELNGSLLDDPRVTVHTGDVVELLETAAPASYEGVLLDVDNGPAAMVQTGNDKLYSLVGLTRIREVLVPGGTVAFWSAFHDKDFEKRLRKCGFEVEGVPTKTHPTAKRPSYMIYYARPSPQLRSE